MVATLRRILKNYIVYLTVLLVHNPKSLALKPVRKNVEDDIISISKNFLSQSLRGGGGVKFV
jgi:hypothetical protein